MGYGLTLLPIVLPTKPQTIYLASLPNLLIKPVYVS